LSKKSQGFFVGDLANMVLKYIQTYTIQKRILNDTQ